jgi:hypothetical protein
MTDEERIKELNDENNYLDRELNEAGLKLEYYEDMERRMQDALAMIALNATGWVRELAVRALAEENIDQKEIEQTWPELKIDMERIIQ